MFKISFNNWRKFQDHVNNHAPSGPTYWRGQRDPDWPLASSFERTILATNGGYKPGASQIFPYDGRFQKVENDSGWHDLIKSERSFFLEEFKKATIGLRGPNPKRLTTNQWWALGRHCGLVTPLLDWTEKPYIAVFFALADFYSHMRTHRSDEHLKDQVAIYRLQPDSRLEDEQLSIVRTKLDELGSSQSQHSLFTWLDSQKYFELQGFLDNTGRGYSLTQILLSGEAFSEGFRDLHAHGIDYRLLFPDLRGAALAANTYADQQTSGYADWKY